MIHILLWVLFFIGVAFLILAAVFVFSACVAALVDIKKKRRIDQR